MSDQKIMIVDDQRSIRMVLKRLLECEGFTIHECQDGKSCLARIGEFDPDIILLDLKMPEMDGLQVLDHLVNKETTAKIIIMTAHGTISSAVEAIKLGAYDYITKPFDNSQLLIVIRRALRQHQTEQELSQAKALLDDRFSISGIVTEDPGMAKILERLVRVAPSDASVLITGESGTGKELFARALHQESKRKNKPFVALNCSAIPEDLIESELFGYRKGAFSGAGEAKKGLVEAAHKGTLFLDEISEMGFQAQAKLLRFTQTGEFYPVGSTSPEKVDVRLISASNRNLNEEIESRSFREDLYFRLNVVALEIPPLRQRPGDIIILIDHFLKKYSAKGESILRFTSRALDLLQQYSWTGNVRELENVVHSSLLTAAGKNIEVEDLPLQVRRSIKQNIQPAQEGNLTQITSEVAANIEKETIKKALRKAGFNQTRAATILGISRRTLFRKIKKHSLDLC